MQLANALHQAAFAGRLQDVVQLLSDGYPVDSVSGRGRTALWYARFAGHTATVALLLEQKASLEAAEPPLVAPHVNTDEHGAAEQIWLDHATTAGVTPVNCGALTNPRNIWKHFGHPVTANYDLRMLTDVWPSACLAPRAFTDKERRCWSFVFQSNDVLHLQFTDREQRMLLGQHLESRLRNIGATQDRVEFRVKRLLEDSSHCHFSEVASLESDAIRIQSHAMTSAQLTILLDFMELERWIPLRSLCGLVAEFLFGTRY
jgi:hypothetical protein